MDSDNILQNSITGDTVEIDDSVIIDITTKTLSTVPGVHSLSPRLYDEIVDGITQAFGQKNLPGINVKHRKGFIEINVYIRVLYGLNIIDLAKKLQLEIRQTLKHVLDLDNVKVDVHIEGVVKE
ncbi:Asp23/Gls24 family envelope stress response protein [Veillonella agrestimuris]|uniref:Asp23/Gls24 family envelope stress response protein n=1 Tax=Veillonella agrestimuris TaxID=2941340 RepID=UPI00203C2E09|nr:Asp23/Gls24 family envelope stress response protein [Veillonella agrestimuris]